MKRTRVSEVFNSVGKKMLFLFDYGDEWHLILGFKDIEPSKKDVKAPLILKSLGEAPQQYEEMAEEDKA